MKNLRTTPNLAGTLFRQDQVIKELRFLINAIEEGSFKQASIRIEIDDDEDDLFAMFGQHKVRNAISFYNGVDMTDQGLPDDVFETKDIMLKMEGQANAARCESCGSNVFKKSLSGKFVKCNGCQDVYEVER